MNVTDMVNITLTRDDADWIRRLAIAMHDASALNRRRLSKDEATAEETKREKYRRVRSAIETAA